jgi:hypothetical protein
MDKTVEYQGYTIQSAPHHLADSEQWRLAFFRITETKQQRLGQVISDLREW